MKHNVKKGINKQFIKLIAPTVILIIGFALSAYYLSNLSGEAASLPPPPSQSTTTTTQSTTSQSMAPQTLTTTTQTTTQTSTTGAVTTSSSSSTATQITSTQTTSPTQTSTSQSSATTTATTQSTSTPTTTTTTTSNATPTTTTTSTKTTASTSPTTPSTFTTPTTSPTPTPAPTTSPASPYTPGSAEDIVYKGITIEVKPQSLANFNSKIQIHIKAPIPNAPNGHKVTAEIHSDEPIVIPTEVANGNIEIDVNQYVSPGNHDLYIKYADPQDSSIFHTIIRKFIVNRVEAASALNSSQFDVNSVGILEIINPLYIYIIAAMVLASITILFIIYKSRDTH